MEIVYLNIVLFGALAIYFFRNDYKHGRMAKETYTALCIIEGIVAIAGLVFLLRSLF